MHDDTLYSHSSSLRPSTLCLSCLKCADNMDNIIKFLVGLYGDDGDDDCDDGDDFDWQRERAAAFFYYPFSAAIKLTLMLMRKVYWWELRSIRKLVVIKYSDEWNGMNASIQKLEYIYIYIDSRHKYIPTDNILRYPVKWCINLFVPIAAVMRAWDHETANGLLKLLIGLLATDCHLAFGCCNEISRDFWTSVMLVCHLLDSTCHPCQNWTAINVISIPKKCELILCRTLARNNSRKWISQGSRFTRMDRNDDKGLCELVLKIAWLLVVSKNFASFGTRSEGEICITFELLCQSMELAPHFDHRFCRCSHTSSNFIFLGTSFGPKNLSCNDNWRDNLEMP